MAVHTQVERAGIYFITFTCYRWLHLLEQTKAYDTLYRFFTFLNGKGHQLLGYTLMPNHVHLLLYFSGGTQSLNILIGNGKRFIGYEIIKRLKAQNDYKTLSLLGQCVPEAEKRRGKQHQLWQGTFDIKNCRTEKFILQKLNYMHQNPCVERWQLCKHTYDFPHSSAAYYEMDQKNNLWLRDYRDFLVRILTSEEEQRQSFLSGTT